VTLVGDALLAGAFTACAGFFDFKQRRQLFTEWEEVLDDFGIRYTEGLSLQSYLSTHSEQLRWLADQLPNDQLCFENAIILKNFKRYPLVIDPSGQATTFLENHYKNQKLTTTSFLDPSFMKHLESALRFGTTLLVHDVDNLDPVLNPVLNREVHRTGGRILVQVGDQEIDFSPSFNLFMITRDPTARFTPDLCSRVTFVNFTVTPASLESQCLSAILKNERPELDERRNTLLRLQGEYKAKLRELEDSLLSALQAVEGNILDDDFVMKKLESLKKEVTVVTRESANTETVMQEVIQNSNFFAPMARSSSRIFFAMEELRGIHFLYHFSLSSFFDVLQLTLKDPALKAKGDDAMTRLARLMDSMFKTIMMRTHRSLLTEDKLVFILHLTQLRLETKLKLTNSSVPAGVDLVSASNHLEKEFDLFISTAPSIKKSYSDNVTAVVAALKLSGTQPAELDFLLSSLPDLAEAGVDVCRCIVSDPDSWAAMMVSDNPEDTIGKLLNVSPDDMTIKTYVHVLLLLKVLRPDRVLAGAQKLTAAVFGGEVLDFSIDLKQIVQKESKSQYPLLLCSATGYDASSQVDDLAHQLKVKYKSVAMGSEEGFDQANRAISGAIKDGSWVLLRNIHLCAEWLKDLEKKLYSMHPSPNFRLFLTSEINPNLPTNLVRLCDVLTFQPPGGVRASLLRSFAAMPAERMDKAPVERSRLYLLLSWLNAIVIERRRYAPLGWTKPYEFSSADQKCAMDAIDLWVDKVGKGRTHIKPESIPWKALRTLLAQSIYGGRIDNRFDDGLLNSFVNEIFVPASFDRNFALVPGSGDNAEPLVVAPEGTSKEAFVKWAEALPQSNSPEWLGLPRTAEIALLIEKASSLRKKLAVVQELQVATDEASDSSSKKSAIAGVPAWIVAIAETCAAWKKSYLPSALTRMERDKTSINSPLFRFLDRETIIAENLLYTVLNDLSDIQGVCAETVKPTNRLRIVMKSLSKGTIPKSEWAKYPMASHESSVWVEDFGLRAKQLNQITSVRINRYDWGRSPLWLGGLFAPEAFITATRQEVSQRLECSLEELTLKVTIGGESEDLIADSDFGSFMVHRLNLEGASWDADAGCLDIGKSDVISTVLPKSSFRWTRTKQDSSNLIEVPMYLNRQRTSLLFTVQLPVNTDVATSVWSQRAVALIAWSRQV